MVVFLCLSTVTWIQRHKWPSKSPLDRDRKDLVPDVTVQTVFAFNRYDVSSHSSNMIQSDAKTTASPFIGIGSLRLVIEANETSLSTLVSVPQTCQSGINNLACFIPLDAPMKLVSRDPISQDNERRSWHSTRSFACSSARSYERSVPIDANTRSQSRAYSQNTFGVLHDEGGDGHWFQSLGTFIELLKLPLTRAVSRCNLNE
ncbi:hypothetical protein J3E69DRAFT_1285 [Trichoderma sp. SZMC 28015]